jgi:hypothetical protein
MENVIRKAKLKALKMDDSEEEDDEDDEELAEDTKSKKDEKSAPQKGKFNFSGKKKKWFDYQEWMEMRLKEIHEFHKPIDYNALK